MSKSLIRKNQLHPDVGDLVSGYGSGYFVTFDELDFILDEYNPQIVLTGQNVVYTTGNQTISGIKNFNSRPTFNGSGLALTGELGGAFNGNRIISAQVAGFQGLQPGGNDVVTFLNNVFYPFTQANIQLNSFPIQELGKSIFNINYQGTITTGSLNLGLDINNWTPFANNAEFPPVVATPSTNFNTIVNFGSPLSNTVSNCFVRINTKNQAGNVITLNSNIQSIIFEAPTFAGSGIDNLQNNIQNMKAVLSGQNPLGGNNGKTVTQKPSSFPVQVYTNNNWFYFVYPSGWGPLSRISNPQLGDFNINTDFIQGFTLLFLDNQIVTHPYRYYKRSLPTTLTNYSIVYHF